MFCEEPIKATHRMYAMGYYEDMWEEPDYQDGVVYHATEGYWLVFETEHFFISIGTDGVLIYDSVVKLQQGGKTLFNELFELESIVFPGECLHDVSESEKGWIVQLSDFQLRIVRHAPEENYEGQGFQTEIPFFGFDHVLKRCSCGGKPEFKVDCHDDFYVECNQCHKFTEAGYIPDRIVYDWNEGKVRQLNE